MQGLADFLLSLLDYFALLSLSLVLGGVAWGLFVLRAGRHSFADEGMLARRCVKVLFAGAVGLALTQPMELGITAWFLGEALQQPPFPAFFYTPQFQGGMTRAILAAGVAVAAAWLGRRPGAARRWAAVTFLAVLLAASGAWLTHAVERFDDRVQLMVLTSLHQLAGAVWLGGLLQLAAAWRLIRRWPGFDAFWPALLGRFSKLAMASVLLLVITGSAVAWPYVGAWKNFIGTTYGLYLILKTALMASALGFAALNFRAVRRWRETGRAGEALQTRVPYFVEAEIVLLLTIVLMASALLALPLAVDVDAANQRASWPEVVEVLKPKWPRLISPSHAEEVVAQSPLSRLSTGIHTAENEWSEFNHDVAGLFLIAIGLFALADWTKRWPWMRHWPLGFVALAAFVVVRSDPETWPLGTVGFWQGTFGSAEVLQHRVASALALALGLIEWRVRSTRDASSRLAYVFPVLCIAGGMVILTHFHSAYSEKYEFLITVSHAPVAILAIVIGCGRWLELRLAPSRPGRWAGFASLVALLVFGLMMAFYREIPGS